MASSRTAARAGAGRALDLAWRKLHLYLALAFGMVFVFSGLSGSTLVFYQAIDEYLNPALLTVERGAEYAPLTEIVAAARAREPETAKLTRLHLPRHPRAAMKARFAVPRQEGEMLLDVWVDPFTAEVLGQRRWGGYLMSFLYQLHHTLFLGDAGKTLIGVAGMSLLVSVIAGLTLWWPRRARLFRVSGFRRAVNRRRCAYRWHITLGACAAPVLVVIAFSGISMIFPQSVKAIVGVVLPFAAPVPATVGGDSGGQRLDIDAVGRIAADLFPRAQLQRIYPPASAGGVYRLIMRQPGEVGKTSGSTRIWIDPRNGDILAVREPKSLPGGDAVFAWLFPLHNGEAFGPAGRMLVFLTGFTPLILYITGMRVWWRKRTARRAQASR